MEGEKNHLEDSKSAAGSSLPTPVCSDGKFLVKLKIPNSIEEIEEGEIVDSSPVRKSTDHVCRECNKGFSSGKALGGHMSSAHVQARDHHKKLKFNKTTKFKRDRSGFIFDDGGSRNSNVNLCELCGKDFRSKKSLFGHMRCHPEREWRGMEPPKEHLKISDNLSTSLSVDDYESPEPDHEVDSAARVMVTDVVDLTESCSSWTVTGKRGREPFIRPLKDPLYPEEEKKLHDAVEHLLSLVNGDSLRPKNNQEFRIIERVEDVNGGSGSRRETRVDRGNFLWKKRRYNETASTDSEKILDRDSDLGKRKEAPVKFESSREKSLSNELHTIMSKLKNQNIVVKNKRRGQKEKPMISKPGGEITPVNQKMDGLTAGVTPEKYKCSTCDKTFSTHQALGGHKSSHNKLRVSILNTSDELASSLAVDDDINHTKSVSQFLETNKIEEVDGSKLVVSVHRCEICHRIFSTGQALGGHKRIHWSGASSQTASSSVEETENSIRKNLIFDLNELPETEDANINDPGNAAGYSSCS